MFAVSDVLKFKNQGNQLKSKHKSPICRNWHNFNGKSLYRRKSIFHIRGKRFSEKNYSHLHRMSLNFLKI